MIYTKQQECKLVDIWVNINDIKTATLGHYDTNQLIGIWQHGKLVLKQSNISLGQLDIAFGTCGKANMWLGQINQSYRVEMELVKWAFE